VSLDAQQCVQGQMCAALMQWPQATCACKVVLDAGHQHALVERETDEGQETLQLRLPAVITADLRLNTPRCLSRDFDGSWFESLPYRSLIV
jgi:electron transfer flavoprotein alpha/beta subunit